MSNPSNNSIQTIVGEDKSTYHGGAISVPGKPQAKPAILMHGYGRLMQFPYLIEGNWDNGKLKQVLHMYIKPNCKEGENFDFAKHFAGEQNLSLVLSADCNPLEHGYTLVENKQV